MGRSRRRFDDQDSADSFAEKVNGQVNDLRDNPEAKSDFTVTYDKTIEDAPRMPENDRDFGYPNSYWK